MSHEGAVARTTGRFDQSAKQFIVGHTTTRNGETKRNKNEKKLQLYVVELYISIHCIFGFQFKIVSHLQLEWWTGCYGSTTIHSANIDVSVNKQAKSLVVVLHVKLRLSENFRVK